MKRIITFTFALLTAMSVCAQKEVVVRPVPNGDPAPTDIPVVTYDDNLINISSEVELKNTHIVVTGKSGEVLYHGVKNLGQSQTTIILPQTESSEKDAIELYCDDKEYCGYFEE